MTRITIYNIQRVATPKADNSELWFLCSANHIMEIYICMKFQENISVFKLQSGHIHVYYRNHYFQCSKGHHSKGRLSNVTVLLFCTWSHDGSHLWEVLSKYLKQFQLTELILVQGRNGYFQYLLCSKGGKVGYV